MKKIPTFCDGTFHGFENLHEVVRLREEAHILAIRKQEEIQADHMIYGYCDCDNNGDIVTARFYSGLSQTDEVFNKTTAMIPNAHIYAIHKMQTATAAVNVKTRAV